MSGPDVTAYVPARGDVVWVQLSPASGHGQAGRRFAMILSPSSYNGRTGLALTCPITTVTKGYPFEVDMPATGGVHGVVLADQVRCIDWRARRVTFVVAAPAAVVAETLRKTAALLA